MAFDTRMLELSHQGFACAQILMQLVLDAEDKTNPDLIRSMTALTNGLRDSGLICGALTGGACILAYFAGQGEPDEMCAPELDGMTQTFSAWFKEQVGAQYGGITCPDILQGNEQNKQLRCPRIVEESFAKAIQLLEENELL